MNEVDNLRRVALELAHQIQVKLESYTGEPQEQFEIRTDVISLNGWLKQLFPHLQEHEQTFIAQALANHAYIEPQPKHYADLLDLVAEIAIHIEKEDLG